MKLIRLLLLNLTLTIFLMITNGCKKDAEVTSPMERLLTGGNSKSWKCVYVIDDDGMVTHFLPCMDDDREIYSLPDKYVQDFGAPGGNNRDCYQLPLQGHWSLNEQDSSFRRSDNSSGHETWYNAEKIIFLSADSLKIKQEEANVIIYYTYIADH